MDAIEPSAKTACLLVDLLNDENEDVRRAVALKFASEPKISEAVLIMALKHHPQVRLRLAALEALTMNPSAEAVNARILALADPSPQVRVNAASGLINGGDAAIPALSNALKDSDAPVRFQAVQTLGAMCLPKAVQALTDALEDQHEKVRAAARAFLDTLKSGNREMSKDLYSDDWQVRRQAVEKLEQTELDSADLSGPPDPNLLEALQDKNPNVRAAAAVALVNNATQGWG